jgi:hypothetical protein
MATTQTTWLGKKAFVIGCVVGFLLFCAVTAYAQKWTLEWLYANCAVDSSSCSAADLFLSYWWLLFVPIILLATFLLHRIYTKRFAAVP